VGCFCTRRRGRLGREERENRESTENDAGPTHHSEPICVTEQGDEDPGSTPLWRSPSFSLVPCAGASSIGVKRADTCDRPSSRLSSSVPEASATSCFAPLGVALLGAAVQGAQRIVLRVANQQCSGSSLRSVLTCSLAPPWDSLELSPGREAANFSGRGEAKFLVQLRRFPPSPRLPAHSQSFNSVGSLACTSTIPRHPPTRSRNSQSLLPARAGGIDEKLCPPA
jgi:hypothetical protein